MSEGNRLEQIRRRWIGFTDIASEDIGWLIAENARLRAEVEDWKRGSQVEAEAGDTARGELANLRIELDNCQQIRDVAIGRLKAGGTEAEIESLRTLVEAQAAEVARIKANHVTVVEETQRRHDAVVPKIVEIARLQAAVEAQSKVVDAARGFVDHHQEGQPGTPGTLYPMTNAALDVWQAGWDFRLDGLIRAVNAFVRRAELDKATTPTDEAVRSFRMGDQP